MAPAEFEISIATDLATIPDWIDINRDYLNLAVARHYEDTGHVVDAEDQLRQTVESIAEFLGSDGRFIIARDTEDALVGMVLLHRLKGGKGEIKRLFVRPEARRSGLAKRLMARLEDEARAMGLGTLYLDTSRGLHEAIRFYESIGFASAAFDPASAQDPEVARHLVVMEKVL